MTTPTFSSTPRVSAALDDLLRALGGEFPQRGTQALVAAVDDARGEARAIPDEVEAYIEDIARAARAHLHGRASRRLPPPVPRPPTRGAPA